MNRCHRWYCRTGSGTFADRLLAAGFVQVDVGAAMRVFGFRARAAA